MSDQYLGEIRLVPYTFAPSGWMFCNGALLNINSNTALFSLLGTTFGGNGQTTFGIPNLLGRVAIGSGQLPGGSNYVLGQASGTENVALTLQQMPAHNHTLTASDQPPNQPGAAANYLPSNTGRGTPLYADSVSNLQVMKDVTTNNGGSQPHPNLQPYLVLNYIIALVGIYPSRS